MCACACVSMCMCVLCCVVCCIVCCVVLCAVCCVVLCVVFLCFVVCCVLCVVCCALCVVSSWSQQCDRAWNVLRVVCCVLCCVVCSVLSDRDHDMLIVRVCLWKHNTHHTTHNTQHYTTQHTPHNAQHIPIVITMRKSYTCADTYNVRAIFADMHSCVCVCVTILSMRACVILIVLTTRIAHIYAGIYICRHLYRIYMQAYIYHRHVSCAICRHSRHVSCAIDTCYSAEYMCLCL